MSGRRGNSRKWSSSRSRKKERGAAARKSPARGVAGAGPAIGAAGAPSGSATSAARARNRGGESAGLWSTDPGVAPSGSARFDPS